MEQTTRSVVPGVITAPVEQQLDTSQMPTTVPTEAAAVAPPLKRAERLVELERRRKAIESDLDLVKKEIAEHKAALLDAMESGDFQTNSRVDGATVFHRTEVWAGPVKDEKGVARHDRLAAVLEQHGLGDLAPNRINSQTFSAWVREQIKEAPKFDDEGNVLTVEQRAALVLPADILSAININEKHEVRVNGA